MRIRIHSPELKKPSYTGIYLEQTLRKHLNKSQKQTFKTFYIFCMHALCVPGRIWKIIRIRIRNKFCGTLYSIVDFFIPALS